MPLRSLLQGHLQEDKRSAHWPTSLNEVSLPELSDFYACFHLAAIVLYGLRLPCHMGVGGLGSQVAQSIVAPVLRRII